MRVVIVGAGEVGSTIASSLAEDHDVVVIDRDEEIVESLTYSMDVLPLKGDGTDVETLEEADVADADLLIACTDDDETNIVACGVAKTVGSPFAIARVKRPQYLRAWRRRRGTFDVDFMVCTDLLAATTIVDVIGLPTAQDVDSFADGLVQMTEFEIPEGSPVAGQTVQEADRFDSLTFAGIFRDDDLIVVRGDTRIEVGDDLVVIGSPESTRQFSASIAPTQEGPQDVVIVGGGEIGFQTARLLEERGFSPRVVEQDADRARWLAENLPDTTVFESDATDQDFLERERVGDADAVIAALENDQQNLLATLLAKRLGAARTIAIVNTGDFADLFEAVGIDVAVSPREATAEEITRFTRENRAANLAMLEGDQAEVVELEVGSDSDLLGLTVKEAIDAFPEQAVVGAIAREGRLVTPRGGTKIQLHDHVVVFAASDEIDAVADRV